MTEEDKKNPKDAARWKAPDTSSDDQGDFWQEQEPVQFLQVPPLADDDKTPVVGLVRKSPPKAEAKPQTVQNLDLNAIQAGLAQLEDEKRSKEAEAIKMRELETIHQAVAQADEDTIKGFITREFSQHRKQFGDLNDFRKFLISIFEAEDAQDPDRPERVINVDLGRLKELSKSITFVVRYRIGDNNPFIKVTLSSESGFGKTGSEKLLKLGEVKEVEDLRLGSKTPAVEEDQRPSLLDRLGKIFGGKK